MQTLGKEVKCFCENQFWCKDVNFGHKNVNMGEMLTSVIYSDKIMLYKIYGKCKCQFWCKNVNFGHKKCIYGRSVDFSNVVGVRK